MRKAKWGDVVRVPLDGDDVITAIDEDDDDVDDDDHDVVNKRR